MANKAREKKDEILIVEDSPTQMGQIRFLLETHGYEVIEAASGEAALALLKDHSPALVITDIVMPGIDGFTLCQRVKASSSLKDIPVVLLTSLSGSDDIVKGLQSGADNFIRKPFEENYLLSRIQYLLVNRQLRKNNKLQMGVELYIGGQRHFITAERQQILDLLISTYEQAVRLKNDLEEREQQVERVSRTLHGLYQIAKGLNQANNEQKLAEVVLDEALDLADFQAGWIDLIRADRFVRIIAQSGVPLDFDKLGPSQENCLCRKDIKTGELRQTRFYPDCQCLQLKEYPSGLRSHVSIPFLSDGHALGFMNLVPKGDVIFSESDLQTFNGIGHQIGIALERLRMKGHLEQLVEERTAKLREEISERKNAEQALRASEKRFKTLFEFAPDAYYLMDTNGIFIDGNAGAESLTGYNRDELIGKNFLESGLIRPDDINRASESLTRLSHGEPEHQDEFMLRRKDGNLVTVEVRTHLMELAGQKVILGIARDITLRKLAETALLESEQRFRSIYENAKDIIFMIDGSGSIARLSPSFETVTGWKSDEWTGRSFLEIVHSDDVDRASMILKGVVEKGESIVFDMCIARKGGTYWEGEFTVGPLYEHGARILFGIGRDVTDRKRSEQQIKEQAALIDITSDAIVVRDLGGKILFWNKGAEKMYGWTKEEAIGKHGKDLFYSGQDDIFPRLRNTLEEKGFWEGEVVHGTKNGRALTVQSSWTLMKDPDRKPTSILCVNTDVTEKKALETQFFRAQRLESLGTLASGIAHDLNNVLGPITLTIDVLARQIHDEKTQKLLEGAAISAFRGKNIVSQILTFARGSEGKRSPVQTKHILKEIVEMIRETFPKNIDIKSNFAKGLRTIIADSTAIHQLVMNIVVNARDAMQSGGALYIEATNFDVDEQFARLQLHAQPGPYIRISISDNGMGMAPEILDRVFDPFFTTKKEGKGTGLGLATVHSITEKHGGFLEVSSKVNHGTTFRVYLPALENGEGVEQKGLQTSLKQGAGQTILVVDDEESVREAMRQTLESFGYRVLMANDGVEGVALLSQHKTDIALVVTDVMMPLMDGPTMLRAIRHMLPDLPVIAASGMIPDSYVELLKSLNCEIILSKPFTANELLEVIQQVVTGPKATAS